MSAGKAAAALLALLACAELGRRKRLALEERLAFIAEFSGDVRSLIDMLELRPTNLSGMAARLRGGVWKRFSALLSEGGGTGELWLRALKEEGCGEAELLRGIGEALALPDRRAQINALTLAARELASAREALSMECARKGKMYSSLGVLTGLSLALLVI